MSEASNIKCPLCRDGNTIYELMHHGWNHGVEVFRNRWWITVQVDSTVSNETSLKIALDIQKALEFHDDMLAALEAASAAMLTGDGDWSHEETEAYDIIEAAIAKAKGGAK